MKAFLDSPFTVPMDVRDYSEWHKGRERYAVWVIDFDEEPILAFINRLRTHFKELLLLPFNRQPHITLFVSGFWQGDTNQNDDYTLQHFEAHQQILKTLDLKTFDIEIGKINSFTSALYLEVHDIDNGIAQLRGALSGAMPELRWNIYTPHVTLGVYQSRVETAQVGQSVDALPAFNKIKTKVNKIKLVTYSATELMGPFETVYTHNLLE